MNKGELDNLRRLIKGQFKLLHSEVQQRGDELRTALEQDLAVRFADDDKRWGDGQFAIAQAVDEANRKANDIYRDLYGAQVWGQRADRQIISACQVQRPKGERARLRAEGLTEIESKVNAALLKLQRRQVELETQLAVSTLESTEAKAFMQQIPTVSDLVPEARLLAAIEAMAVEDGSKGD